MHSQNYECMEVRICSTTCCPSSCSRRRLPRNPRVAGDEAQQPAEWRDACAQPEAQTAGAGAVEERDLHAGHLVAREVRRFILKARAQRGEGTQTIA